MAKYQQWITEEGLIRIRGWAMDGLDNEDIAYNMNISRSTLNNWSNKFPELYRALHESKDIADRRVENSLYKRALGQMVLQKKAVKVKKTEYDKITGKKVKEEEVIEMVDEEHYIPPDTKAITFWLSNRKPEDWRFKINVNENEGEEAGIIMLNNPLIEQEVEEYEQTCAEIYGGK
ncbi:MAG: hypothetical protein E7265_06675 [Lachnospiraceae bacterium]|nr:hypothetical protein [Lachnospiraceae bacterium]